MRCRRKASNQTNLIDAPVVGRSRRPSEGDPYRWGERHLGRTRCVEQLCGLAAGPSKVLRV